MKLHARVIAVAAWIVALPVILFAQDPTSGKDRPLAFRTAIELAIKNSAITGLAQADLRRVRATVTSARCVSAADGARLRAGRFFTAFRSAWKARRHRSSMSISRDVAERAQRNYVKAARK